MNDSPTLTEGDPLPDLQLHDDEGRPVRLGDLHGKRVVLYFYPKDDTPGCTRQACSLRDSWPTFQRDDIVLYGVSGDSAESHTRFREKYSLPFNLLVDDEHLLADALGFWGEKTSFGKTKMGILRGTAIIGADGTVERIFRKVKPDQHTDLVAEALGLTAGATS